MVAGAGTGKTQVITRRVAWLIAEKRATPEQILALTFTDRAADEMQGRVDRLVPYGYATTPIKTFHAWGDELLRENAHRIGISGELRVLGRAEVVLLLREHLFDLGLSRFLPLGDPTRFLGDIAGFFSRAKEEAVDADRIEALVAACGLPTVTPALGVARFLELMAIDKKNEGGDIRYIVLHGLGQAAIEAVPQAVVRDCLAALGQAA